MPDVYIVGVLAKPTHLATQNLIIMQLICQNLNLQKSSFMLSVGVNHPQCLCLLQSDSVWVQGIFVLAVTGFDNVCRHAYYPQDNLW